ncbi:tyrosyl-DNA phosphodiesterase-domain-containing protein [Xylaria bambusicola]|uniref:tyrosyl-DNA phosphodiesterase-domain-containing protein n=1 Tax=Xylaria bambusicola TaxID=326684 RepID=UPI0020080645|nr:tyrosyl-DNA phosphodiesterase-domain-containing protein [Xylaria bambusicola]KAI0526361.1 tyrosyl-DNA phosphodiesterase-domain-containing protein [Xylaria bambusicola]
MDSHQDPFDGDEEAALRYAIALSLQDPNVPASPSTAQRPIVLDEGEDEEEDLENGPKCPPTPKKPSQLAGKPTRTLPATSHSQIAPHATPSHIKPSSLSSLGLDRKKMEEERLARVAKRKAPPDEDALQRLPQRIKIDGQPKVTPLAAPAPISSASTKSPQLPYPKGVVRRTWAAGYPRQDDIKIEEIFQKDQLELAVLSSFQWDDEWLLTKINVNKTKLVCIAFASNDQQKEAMRANVPRDRIRFCFPPMMPAGSMHSKLQLLKFPNYLRLVIPTGNLVPYDWGETGVMENMVFLIDLPTTTKSETPPTMFNQELCYFLTACGLDSTLINSLSKYDFSETSQYRFIHTIGQSHIGDAWQRTGYCGLGRAVESLGLTTDSEVELDFVVASLGSVSTDLTSAIYNATQGDNGLKEYNRRTNGGPKKKATQKVGPSYHPDNFRIYFPSHETVSRSRGGKNSGGTICLQSKWWDSPMFPRELVHDCESVRPGLLMHTKILFVRHPHRDKSHWAYLGSANLSESAWGRLVKDRASGQPKLNCRNWECGVLIPMESQAGKSGWSSFENRIPIPMIVPGEAYGKTNSKRPWLFLEA